MEGEINNFIKVWISVFISLCYCYVVCKLLPKGKLRLMVIFPVVCLFLALPLNLHSMHLGGTTAFFIAWLTNFKLLMFAFDKGPLSDPSLSLQLFLAIACFPIKIQPTKHHPIQINQNPQKTHKSAINYAVKLLILALMVKLYDYSEFLHPKMVMFLYSFHIYFALEIILAVVAAAVRSVSGLELEPQFDDPYLSSSLQDFWGRRWNMMVSRVMRPSVYEPTIGFYSKILGRKWAPIPAIFTTFVVSGIMHELLFYYMGRLRPTWEVTSFFLLHGVCLMLEIAIKKACRDVWHPPRVVSGTLTFGFVMITGFWLFFPPFLRFDADVRAFQEYANVGAFLKDLGKVFVLTV